MKYILAFLIFCNFISFGQEGRLRKTDLFSISTQKFGDPSGYNFRIAVDSRNHIALNACSMPYIYIYDTAGTQIDSVKIPVSSCIRNMDFDENDNLLIMDNDELVIYFYNTEFQKLELKPYQKPEDWFILLNHYFSSFRIESIPTYYSNNDYLQDFYHTRFNYSYNLFLNSSNGFIYQCHYNFIKKIDNHTYYTNPGKKNYWLSDNISVRTKILKIDDEKNSAIYYDRFYNLIYENFNSGLVVVNPALTPNSEAARFDYATNIKQDAIYGISSFNKTELVISRWE